jgi:hypothetical protein
MAKALTLPMSKRAFNIVAQTLRDILGNPDHEKWVVAPQELGITIVIRGRAFVGCHLVRDWDCGCEADFDFGNDPQDGQGQINLHLCPRHKTLITEKLKGHTLNR